MYYDSIASGYDELHKEEQEKKLHIILQKIEVRADDTVLDVGCGTGVSSQLEGKVTGIDPSKELLAVAQKKGTKVVLGKAEQLPFEDGSFDVVISLTAAQNFTDLEQGIKEIKRVGKRRFAISILKKSSKLPEFKKLGKEVFPDAEWIEEEKDIILIVT